MAQVAERPPDLDAAGQPMSTRPPDLDASGTPIFRQTDQTPNELDSSPLIRAATQFYDKSPLAPVVNTLEGAANVITHPIDTMFGLVPIANTVKGLARAQWDQVVIAAQKAKEAVNGDKLSAVEALGHGLAAVLPLLGPASADVGEHGARGDYAGMAGGATGLLLPFAAKYGLEVKQSGSLRPTTQKIATATADVSKADRLTREAEDAVSQRVLAPANPKFKPTATAIAPEVLARGLSGDRIALQQAAEQGMSDAGSAIDAAQTAQGGPSAAISVTPIIDRLDARIAEYQINGKTMPTALEKVAQLKNIKSYLKDQGPSLPLADILKARDELYETAAKAGGYAKQGNPALGDLAWAAREAGSAIREHLADLNPTAAAGRADYTFWKSLNDVLDPDLGRPKSGVPSAGVTGGRATIGAVIANAIDATPIGKAAVAIGLGKIFPMLQDLTNSPAWQLAKASDKYALAQAIRKGNPSMAAALITRIAAAAPRAVGPASRVATSQQDSTPAAAQR